MRLFADGGELTVLRSLAAFAYGGWSVEWPEAVPDGQRPELPDDRNFGYVSRMSTEPGRMGRRFVRDDVSIEAFEPGVDGARLPDTGFSDVEETLDAAARRTTGDTFFEFEFTREHLGELVPFVDFGVGDLVEVVIWGRSLVVPVVSIDSVSDQGAVVDWRVRVGGTLVGDRAELDRSYREVRRDLLREQRERRDAVSAVRSHADSVVARERSERQEDVNQVREVLGGARADEQSLVSQLAAVQAQITGMVGAGETPPPPGLLNSYLWMNTRLWEAQRDVNQLNEAFQAEVRERQREQQALNRKQNETLQLIQRQWTRFWTFDDSMSWGTIGGTRFVDYGVSGGNFKVTAYKGYPMDYGAICHVEALNNYTVFYSGSLDGGETKVHDAGVFQKITRGLFIMQPRW